MALHFGFLPSTIMTAPTQTASVMDTPRSSALVETVVSSEADSGSTDLQTPTLENLNHLLHTTSAPRSSKRQAILRGEDLSLPPSTEASRGPRVLLGSAVGNRVFQGRNETVTEPRTMRANVPLREATAVPIRSTIHATPQPSDRTCAAVSLRGLGACVARDTSPLHESIGLRITSHPVANIGVNCDSPTPETNHSPANPYDISRPSGEVSDSENVSDPVLATDVFEPDLAILKQMHAVCSELPEKIIALLGDVSFGTWQNDLARWRQKLQKVPVRLLKPLSKELSYHTRNGNKKRVSVHGTKDLMLKRLLTYGYRYAQQKNTQCDPSPDSTVFVEPTRNLPEGGATLIYSNADRESATLRALNYSQSRLNQRLNQSARSLADQEANEACTNSDFIGALSANEICRALHALCNPESLSAARKVFQDSSRLELDASCSQGMSPVDAGWTFIANIYNDATYKPANVRSLDVELKHLDPSKIETPRGPESLKTAVSGLRSSYQEAERKFFKSGNNDAEFFSYCNGNSVLVYCHYLLKEAPHIRAAFPRSLPINVGISTGGDAQIPDRPRRERQNDADSEPSLLQPSRKKRNSAKAEIGAALREHTVSLVQMKEAQFAKATELREKDLELRKSAIEERSAAQNERVYREKVRKNKEVGDALCSLNASAKMISDQIADTHTSLASETLQTVIREQQKSRLKTLKDSYERVSRLIEETLKSSE